MLTLEMIVEMLVWPALASALVVATAWAPAVARSGAAVLIAPVAIVVGFVAGYVVVVGLPDLVPALNATARLPHSAVIGLVVAAGGVASKRRLVRWAIALLGALVTMRLVLGSAIELQWSMTETLVRVSALAAGLAAATLLAAEFVERVPERAGSLGLAAIAGVAAPIMLFSDSLMMAQLHGVLGVAAGVLAVGVWLAPARISLRAAAPVVITIAWSHWVIGLLFANTPLASFVLLAIAPLAATLASHALSRMAPRRHALAAVFSLSVFVVGAVAIGGLRYARSTAVDVGAPDDSDASYGYYE